MSITNAGMPNIRVVIREAADEKLTVDIPNLAVTIQKDSDYNVNITPSVTVVLRTGSYDRFADVALLAYTASYVSGSDQAISSSYAVTASYAHTINRQISGSVFITGSTTITDNLNVEGIITAEKLLVSSSVIYESGSTKFGDSPEDTHEFTGSVLVQGPISSSAGITGSFKGDGSQLTGLVTDLRFSGSVGSDTLSLLTDDLIISGNNGIVTTVTNNTLTIDVPVALTASLYGTASVADGIDVIFAGLYETGSAGVIIPTPSGGLSYITTASYALTASYIANNNWTNLLGIPDGLVSSSVQVYYFPVATSSVATSASYAVTASYALNGGGGGGGGSGTSGTSGTSGQNGTSGSSGTSGTSGSSGTAGSSGTSGSSGSSGSSGTSGTSGSSGSSGTSGTSGSSGSSGSSGTSGTSSLVNTGSFATTGSNVFVGNQTITGSLNVTQGITGSFSGSITSASYALTASYAQNATATLPAGTVSSSTQVSNYNIFATTGSNQFNGNQAITGSLTITTGSVVATLMTANSSSLYLTIGSNLYVQNNGIVEVTGSLTVTGSFVLPTSAPASPRTGSMYFSGSFIYVYTGTQYRSASLV